LVDFAPHTLEELRTRHAHRRLGFADDEIHHWFAANDLAWQVVKSLPGEVLTVKIWTANRSLAQTQAATPVRRSSSSRI